MTKIKRILYLKFGRAFGKNNDSNNNANVAIVPTIIAENTKIVGDISSSGTLHIDGRVEGDICCDELIIGTKGKLFGMVKANTMQIYGSLQGKVKVDSLFVAKSASLVGDASHNTIAIEPGAHIEGHCIRAKAEAPAKEEKSLEAPTTAAKSKTTKS